MKDPKDLLLSAMIPPDMLDENDDKSQSEVVGDVIVQYDALQIIDGIGKDYFKENYLNFIDDFKKQSFSNQKVLCDHIINKVQEVYNFEFPEKVNIDNRSDIEDIYEFLRFLEYDNMDFLINIFKGFNVDFLKDDPHEFCQIHKDDIIEQINYYDKANFPSIFENLNETLETDIIINIVIIMILKNKEILSNELKIKKLQMKLEKEL